MELVNLSLLRTVMEITALSSGDAVADVARVTATSAESIDQLRQFED